MKCIEQNSLEDLFKAFQKMTDFQITHNELRKDFQTLYDLATSKLEKKDTVNPLIRSCYKELFSLIEADLYLLNRFNPYDGYRDNEKLILKFKKTYRHHAATFEKNNVKLKYQSQSFENLLRQKYKRDEFSHPKGSESLEITPDELTTLYIAYVDYNNYINELMTNVGVSISVPSL